MVDETPPHEGLPITKLTARARALCHCVSVNVELEKEFDLEIGRALPSTRACAADDRRTMYTPCPFGEGRDEVFVGRNGATSASKRRNLWVVADNVRKGAATNAVQIAQKALERMG